MSNQWRLPDELLRSTANVLRDLGTLEAIALSGIEELRAWSHDVCAALNGTIGIDTLLAVSNQSNLEWSITYQGRAFVIFSCGIGSVPSVVKVIARCEVSSPGEIPVIFHLAKQNDHGTWWRTTSGTDPEAVSATTILRLVNDAARKERRRFDRANGALASRTT